MNLSIQFASRNVLNKNQQLEEKIITEIFELSMHHVILTDFSDVFSLQDLVVTQKNLIAKFELFIQIEILEKMTMKDLVENILQKNE